MLAALSRIDVALDPAQLTADDLLAAVDGAAMTAVELPHEDVVLPADDVELPAGSASTGSYGSDAVVDLLRAMGTKYVPLNPARASADCTTPW